MTLEFTFNSDASAGNLGYRGSDFAAIALQTFEAPYAGWVAWISVTALGGNFDAAVFLIQIETTADADSSFAPGAAATGYQAYAPNKVTFVAGNSIAVELDSVTTMRDCVVTVGLVLNHGNN